MSQTEARRVYVMEQVVKGAISIRRASTLLVLSERQVKHLKKGMNTVGIEALAHKSRGRKPHHALSEDTRTLIRSLGAGPFRGTSCTHMRDKDLYELIYYPQPD